MCRRLTVGERTPVPISPGKRSLPTMKERGPICRNIERHAPISPTSRLIRTVDFDDQEFLPGSLNRSGRTKTMPNPTTSMRTKAMTTPAPARFWATTTIKRSQPGAQHLWSDRSCSRPTRGRVVQPAHRLGDHGRLLGALDLDRDLTVDLDPTLDVGDRDKTDSGPDPGSHRDRSGKRTFSSP